jgi:hypothetical protein
VTEIISGNSEIGLFIPIYGRNEFNIKPVSMITKILRPIECNANSVKLIFFGFIMSNAETPGTNIK